MPLLAGSLTAFAPPYTIDWWTVDGGGGDGTGGTFVVSGTVGQPDAGKRCLGCCVLKACGGGGSSECRMQSIGLTEKAVA
ncbi:MAG: hypothetical protein NT167_00780 [Verrucomicrobia bacterium]|nr:hypothetical protein [Verrucomicrobiota bacterium]